MHKTLVQPFWENLVKGIAGHFGENCEVVIHDLSQDAEHSIVYIENGHITGRKVGDGSSRVVLEALAKKPEELHDRISYLTQTENGRILKSSTIYIRDNNNKVVGILGINYDITSFMMMDYTLQSLIKTQDENDAPEKINKGVNGLLDELIEQSARLINKPVAQMNREDKIRAIQFLHDAGAFLITRSGDKVSKFFGISKYTLYNYIDLKEDEEEEAH
ncbi:MAG: helix-turn-helix transcriptional regulator [Eubacteriales bacterium]